MDEAQRSFSEYTRKKWCKISIEKNIYKHMLQLYGWDSKGIYRYVDEDDVNAWCRDKYGDSISVSDDYMEFIHVIGGSTTCDSAIDHEKDHDKFNIDNLELKFLHFTKECLYQYNKPNFSFESSAEHNFNADEWFIIACHSSSWQYRDTKQYFFMINFKKDSNYYNHVCLVESDTFPDNGKPSKVIFIADSFMNFIRFMIHYRDDIFRMTFPRSPEQAQADAHLRGQRLHRELFISPFYYIIKNQDFIKPFVNTTKPAHR